VLLPYSQAEEKNVLDANHYNLATGWRRHDAYALTRNLKVSRHRKRLVLSTGSKPLDLDNHVTQSRWIPVENFSAVLSDDNRVGMTKATPIGIVNTRLAAERHAHL